MISFCFFALQQIAQTKGTVRKSQFLPSHGVHLHNSKTPCPTMQTHIVVWISRTCENKLTFLFAFVHLVAYIIPNFGLLLPFINQAWCCTDKQQHWVGCHYHRHLRVDVHRQYALCKLLGSFGFPTRFWTFHKHCSRCRQIVGQLLFGYSFNVSHNGCLIAVAKIRNKFHCANFMVFIVQISGISLCKFKEFHCADFRNFTVQI